MNLRTFLTVLLLAIASLALGYGYHIVQDSSYMTLYGLAFIVWTSYLFAHYAENGKYVDQGDGGPKIDREHLLKVLPGAGMMVLGFLFAAIGIPGDRLYMTLAGSFSFIFGYATIHYAVTGKLL